jgi:antitoxin component of RelBE/YafQ-DinJ toxin-antitoxin module
MSNPTVMFRARIDKRRVANAERILSKIGVTPGQFVGMAFAQVELKNGIPFPLTALESDDGFLPHRPNAVTTAAINEPLSALRRHATVASALGRITHRAQGRSKKPV